MTAEINKIWSYIPAPHLPDPKCSLLVGSQYQQSRCGFRSSCKDCSRVWCNCKASSLRDPLGTPGPNLPLPLASGSSGSLEGGWARDENRLETGVQDMHGSCFQRVFFGGTLGQRIEVMSPRWSLLVGAWGCSGTGSGGSAPRASLRVGRGGRRGRGASVRLPPPGKGERRGCWGGAGPHFSQGSDVGRNRLSEMQTAVCSESLLIPGPGERPEPEGELSCYPGTWERCGGGAGRERLGAAGPDLSPHGWGPVSHPHPGLPSF